MARLGHQSQYIIRVEGHVDSSLLDWYGPVDIASAVEDDGGIVTTLSGFVADQAGFVGLIRYLHGLGIIVLSVERVALGQ